VRPEVERQGDLPGEMIPYVYFEFLRTLEAFRVVPIFHHNAIDILSLACLTAIVPFAFRSPEEAPGAGRRRAGGVRRVGWIAQRTAFARSKNWPSTTSTASAITPWRWRRPARR
jgi:hypothetical protein